MFGKRVHPLLLSHLDLPCRPIITIPAIAFTFAIPAAPSAIVHRRHPGRWAAVATPPRFRFGRVHTDICQEGSFRSRFFAASLDLGLG